jgi:hypothetical protein
MRRETVERTMKRMVAAAVVLTGTIVTLAACQSDAHQRE